MNTFKIRLAESSKSVRKIILANDYDFAEKDILHKTITNIQQLHPFLSGIKLNFHLLLPLCGSEIIQINKAAHEYNLQTIADIKLNDIGNTNNTTIEYLWYLGFDAVIVNPIMGFESLTNLVKLVHESNHGIITLCHMSAPEAKLSYDLKIMDDNQQQHLYQLFLDWALAANVDGIVVGATFPEIIKYCATRTRNIVDIFSPGIGTQGGNADNVINAGTNYLIVGRTILNATSPIDIARELSLGLK